MKRIGFTLMATFIMTFPLISQTVIIPDTTFLYALIEAGVDINEDSLISYAEAEAITSLNISGTFEDPGEITDMTGIEAFINLDTLNCSKNMVTSLNVSDNTALSQLKCDNNFLTNLDISSNTALEDLSCGWNQLSNLDVSNNILLEWIICWNNELTSLDISYNPALIGLYIQDNLIDILDVSNNTALKYLRCRGNQLYRLDVTNNISLTSISIDEMPTLTCVSVWEIPFPPDGVEIDTTGSQNVVFTTEYCAGLEIGLYHIGGLDIYPNPTKGMLTVKLDLIGHSSLEITSLNGQLIFSGELEGTSHQIDLSSFQKGIYFITIRSKDFVTTEKIIKL